jgi:hypothetical protein
VGFFFGGAFMLCPFVAFVAFFATGLGLAYVVITCSYLIETPNYIAFLQFGQP